jgi:hypothetical protein
MKKGCWIYAVEAVCEGENSSAQLHPVLAEYQDVFPPELPGFPPVRQFAFSIPWKLGTEPIPKYPYRMTVPELQELGVQLKTLIMDWSGPMFHPRERQLSLWRRRMGLLDYLFTTKILKRLP